MSSRNVRRAIEDLGNGLYAYVQGDGSWGWSNSGLITAQGESLLIDTLFTLDLTQDMLDAFRDAVPSARRIGCLVNTHANGDHTFGNQLVRGARIVGSKACVEEMEERPAEVFADTMRRWKELGEAGQFLHDVMGAHFDFSGITHTPPTETFSRRTDLRVGDVAIELHELGPAHTRGDIVAYVPSARTVFTGDIVFNGGHPIVWAGPISNWIEACDRILGWNVDIVVPGHGPVTDLATVQSLREYFVFVRDESEKRFKAGMPFADAAWDIALDAFDSWIDRERIVANVAAAYRELSGGRLVIERNEILALMGRYRSGARTPHEPGCTHNHSHD